MARSKKKKEMKKPESEKALEKYVEENTEIAQALEVMRETMDIRNLHPIYLDRFSYHSIQ